MLNAAKSLDTDNFINADGIALTQLLQADVSRRGFRNSHYSRATAQSRTSTRERVFLSGFRERPGDWKYAQASTIRVEISRFRFRVGERFETVRWAASSILDRSLILPPVRDF